MENNSENVTNTLETATTNGATPNEQNNSDVANNNIGKVITNRRERTKSCRVLYAKNGKVAVSFDGYGIELPYDKEVGDKVNVSYEGAVGTASFKAKINGV